MIYPGRCPKNPDDDITTISIARCSVMSFVSENIRMAPNRNMPLIPERECHIFINRLVNRMPPIVRAIQTRLFALRETHCSQDLDENTLASRNSVKIQNACVNDDRQNQTDRNDDRWDKPGTHCVSPSELSWVRHASSPPSGRRYAVDGKLVSGGAQYASTQKCFATSPSLVVRKFMRIAVCLKSIQWPTCQGPIWPRFSSSFSLVASRATPKIPPTGNVITLSSEFGITIILSPRTAGAFSRGKAFDQRDRRPLARRPTTRAIDSAR